MADDGRRAAQHAADFCVCAYCWGSITQIFDDESHRWIAICPANRSHVGFHHQSFMRNELFNNRMRRQEVMLFYRKTPFAGEFGIEVETPESLQAKFERNKKIMHDDTFV